MAKLNCYTLKYKTIPKSILHTSQHTTVLTYTALFLEETLQKIDNKPQYIMLPHTSWKLEISLKLHTNNSVQSQSTKFKGYPTRISQKLAPLITHPS